MTEPRKFTILISAAVGLVLLALASHSLLDPYLSGLVESGKRKLHYESVIRKKGLDLHKGMYWREKE